MEKQYIDLKDFKAFNIINNCINEIKAKDSYYIQEDELYEKIWEIVKKLELKLTSIEIKIINEIIKFFKGCDYDLNFIKNSNIDSIGKVYNFIYWKYRNKNSDLKIDLNKLKKILGLKLNGSYQKDVSIPVICKECNGNGEIIIIGYDKLNEYTLRCNNCNHTWSKKYDYIFPIVCNCEKCSELNEKFYGVMKSNFNELLGEIEDYIIALSNKYLDVTKSPFDHEMFEDWKIYRLDLDKDLREIFSYKPRDIEELIKILNKIDERNKIYNNKAYRQNILDKLYKFKILYKCSKIKNDVNKDDLIKKTTHMICGNICTKKDENIITNIKKFINECNSLEQFKNGIKLYKNSKRLLFNVKKRDLIFNCDFCMHNHDKYDIYLEWLLEGYIIENNYFFNYNEVINIAKNASNIKKIFHSGVEESMYIGLRNRYPRNIILPNYNIKNIIDLDKIRKELSEDEYEYLSKEASFNFVVCNLEGIPIKVIQVQRGEHHNKKEWIVKDKTKEKVCRITNLEFEEVF